MAVANFSSDIQSQFDAALRRSVGGRNFEHWFAQTSFEIDESFGDNDEPTLIVHAPNRFTADRIRARFVEPIRDAACDTAKLGPAVRVDVREAVAARSIAARSTADQPNGNGQAAGACDSRQRISGNHDAPASSPAPTAASVRSAASRLRHDLSQFVVGDSNRLAYNAAVAVANDEAPDHSHPLFIHGGCGLGKTHLLQGLCKRFAQRRSGGKWRYMTAEQFTNEFLIALRDRKLPAFRTRLRSYDLLVVDDVHFLSSKAATQAEFLHTFNSIDGNEAKMVIASDNHPKAIDSFSSALTSRFLGGMVVQIEPPGDALRRQLVRSLAERRGLRLSEAAADAVAQRCRGSAREIEGALTTLAALARENGNAIAGDHDTPREIGMALTHRLSAAVAAGVPARPLGYEQIAQPVCEFLQVTEAQLAGRGRQKSVVIARGMITYLCRRMTSLSFPDIARAMGRSSHSTVLTAAKRIEQQIQENVQIQTPPDGRSIALDDLADLLRSRVLESAARIG